ncbi:hypothetical protein T484DRAFT_1853260 [Baffinella frigidus]|nr:hypothetical protein T484DRAFT_1853260 [Cryptophyta sp. CCMP2293]
MTSVQSSPPASAPNSSVSPSHTLELSRAPEGRAPLMGQGKGGDAFSHRGSTLASPWAASPGFPNLRQPPSINIGTPKTPYGVRGRATHPLDAGEDGSAPSAQTPAMQE